MLKIQSAYLFVWGCSLYNLWIKFLQDINNPLFQKPYDLLIL